MTINFFDDSDDKPRMREDVQIRDIHIEVSPEGRRIAVDFDITPFIERPSVDIRVHNASGEPAGSLKIIETLDKNFGVVVHLRDSHPTQTYELTATLYYASLEEGTRQAVDTMSKSFDIDSSTE